MASPANAADHFLFGRSGLGCGPSGSRGSGLVGGAGIRIPGLWGGIIPGLWGGICIGGGMRLGPRVPPTLTELPPENHPILVPRQSLTHQPPARPLNGVFWGTVCCGG